MQYDEFMKIGTTADQLQAIIDGHSLRTHLMRITRPLRYNHKRKHVSLG